MTKATYNPNYYLNRFAELLNKVQNHDNHSYLWYRANGDILLNDFEDQLTLKSQRIDCFRHRRRKLK